MEVYKRSLQPHAFSEHHTMNAMKHQMGILHVWHMINDARRSKERNTTQKGNSETRAKKYANDKTKKKKNQNKKCPRWQLHLTLDEHQQEIKVGMVRRCNMGKGV